MILRAFRHDQVDILNGGCKRWTGEDRPVSSTVTYLKRSLCMMDHPKNGGMVLTCWWKPLIEVRITHLNPWESTKWISWLHAFWLVK